MNKSPKKARVYFIIGQVLFWYSFVCGIIYPLTSRGQKAGLFSWIGEFSGCITFNTLIYISFVLLWRNGENLPPDELNKRKFWLKYFPRSIVIVFILGVIVTLGLLLVPVLIHQQ